MGRAYDTHMTGARMARAMAADYRAEAESTQDAYRREVCLCEAEYAEGRANWYEAHAALFITRQEREAA
jgi:hypothetical protein